MLKRNNFREICVYLHAKTIKRKKIMATTTARRRTSQPIMKAWNAVKGLDYSDKLELVTMLIDSIKPVSTAPLADIPMDEEFADMDKEMYTPEEAYELTMKDIKAIYDDATV